MSFSVSDDDRRLRVLQRLAEWAVRQARASGDAVVSPDGGRPARGSTAPPASCCAAGQRHPLRRMARARRASPTAFVERLIVPQVVGRLVGRPAAALELSRRASSREFFDNHGILSLRDRPRWRTIRGGSARYVEALTRPFAHQLQLGTPCRRSTRGPDDVLVRSAAREPERFDEVVIATHSDQALALLADADRSRARDPRCDSLPAQRGGAAHRRAACCPRAGERGRAGTTTCSSVPATVRR